MLIKRATPAGATGRVYGTVYSGLDSGFAVAAPMFGWMMDHQMHSQVFFWRGHCVGGERAGCQRGGGAAAP